MRYLLDTMVISEPARPAPHPGVIAWLTAQADLDLGLSVLTVGELARGVARMAEGKRKKALAAWLATEVPAQFEGRILSIETPVALTWGALTAEAERQGRPLHVVDGLLLATAKVHGLTLVTRNMGDFSGRGVAVENPYELRG